MGRNYKEKSCKLCKTVFKPLSPFGCYCSDACRDKAKLKTSIESSRKDKEERASLKSMKKKNGINQFYLVRRSAVFLNE